MKLFYVNISIRNKEIIDFTAQSNGGYMDTHSIVHNCFGDSCLVYGVIKVNSVQEALNSSLEYIKNNKLI